MRPNLFAIAVAFAALGTAAQADDYGAMMRAYLENNIATWANDPVLVAAIEAQNTKTTSFSQQEIDSLDLIWRAESTAPDASSTIQPVLNNAAAEFLRKHVAASGGVISEAFVMDAVGLNVAASDVTSDYWQGDEAKWQETYPMGAGAVHIGDVEFDESSLAVQGQVSMVITNDAGSPIIKIEDFNRRPHQRPLSNWPRNRRGSHVGMCSKTKVICVTALAVRMTPPKD